LFAPSPCKTLHAAGKHEIYQFLLKEVTWGRNRRGNFYIRKIIYCGWNIEGFDLSKKIRIS
jgi:hypothetical protein